MTAGQIIGAGNKRVDLGALGRLCLVENSAAGIRTEVLAQGLSVRFRSGGEKIRPLGHKRSHKLKKLLQQEGVVPWMRDKIPLLYRDDKLVAVADFWIAAEFAEERGKGIEWRHHPPVF